MFLNYLKVQKYKSTISVFLQFYAGFRVFLPLFTPWVYLA